MNFWYVGTIFTWNRAHIGTNGTKHMFNEMILEKSISPPTRLQFASSDLSLQSFRLSHLERVVRFEHKSRQIQIKTKNLLIRSIQTPSVQVNSSELQELKTKELILLSSFILSCFISFQLPTKPNKPKTNLRDREMVWSWVLQAKSPLTRHSCFPAICSIILTIFGWRLTNHHGWYIRVWDGWYSWVVRHRNIPLVQTLVVLDFRVFLSWKVCRW